MVERLKIAVAKARAMREQAGNGMATEMRPSDPYGARRLGATIAAEAPRTEAEFDAARIASAWQELESIQLDAKHLERNRLFGDDKLNAVHAAFDVLRTRILRVFRKHGWTRLGISSPGKSCGKTFTATNLALSFSRQPEARTILMDMDLRAPSLAKVLGIAQPEPISWMLSGEVAPQDFLRRVGHNLALGVNSKAMHNAGEVILASSTVESLSYMIAELAPDIVIYDLPPMLVCDDVVGFLPNLDCVLLVAGGGRTKPSEITECERLLEDQTQLLGIVLNQAEDASVSTYYYG